MSNFSKLYFVWDSIFFVTSSTHSKSFNCARQTSFEKSFSNSFLPLWMRRKETMNTTPAKCQEQSIHMSCHEFNIMWWVRAPLCFPQCDWSPETNANSYNMKFTILVALWFIKMTFKICLIFSGVTPQFWLRRGCLH